MDDAGLDAGSLLVLIDSSGSGVVTSDPAGIECGLTCYAHFPLGSKVRLTGTPDSMSVFGGFIGPGCSGFGDCTVTIDGDVGVVAQFGVLLPAKDAGVDAAVADAGSRPILDASTSFDAGTSFDTSTFTAGGGCSEAPVEAHGVCVIIFAVAISRFRGAASRWARRRC